MKLPYSGGSNRFETFETHRIHVKLPYTAGLLVVLTDSKLETHQIHVKVHFSGGLLVVGTDSKRIE